MNKNYKKLCFLASSVALMSVSHQTFAQQNKSAEIIRAGVKDAAIISQAYLNPLLKGLGTNQNNEWYNTAQTHNLGRFDLSMGFSFATIPAAEQSFDLKDLPISANGAPKGDVYLRYKDPNLTVAPTVMGNAVNGPTLILMAKDPNGIFPDQKVSEFSLPAGIGYNIVPTPSLQLTLGLVKNTDLMVRFIPRTNVGTNLGLKEDYGYVQLLGFGIKHDIKQWIPAIAALPFDWSVYGTYSNMINEYNLEFIGSDNKKYDDQKLKLTLGAYSFGTIVSKKFSILTLYAGAGYESSNSDLKLLGTYVFTTGGNFSGGTYVPKNEKVIDPLAVNSKITNNARINAGFKLKLLFLTLHADYTYSTYSIFGAGLGLAIGK